jgi:hypothetical protein
MHRSGTSLFASWLQRCGLVIADRGLHPATAGNDLGHFEDVEFERLNRRAILRACEGSRGWVLPHAVDLHFSWRERSDARRLIRRRSRKYSVWGWKDPRSSLFLEEYERLIPGLKVCALWRPEAEVVDSLLRRAAVTENPQMLVTAEEALQCWRTYNGCIARYAAERPEVLVLPLHALLDDDRATFDRVNRLLDGRLRYVPLRTVYDERLLHRRHQ